LNPLAAKTRPARAERESIVIPLKTPYIPGISACLLVQASPSEFKYATDL
jgi:hypothetical protein